MIVIDREGNFIPGNTWWRSLGPAVEDKESPYVENETFLVVLPYTEKQKKQWADILELKNHLSATDYQPNKYIEGEYTEEEWEQKKAQRKIWREEIREIEKDFVEPTITLEEVREAERKAIEEPQKQKEQTEEVPTNASTITRY